MYVLGVGETLRVANTGSAACILYYSYYDISATNRTLVRTHFSSPAEIIIPAAAAGTYNKWLAVGVDSGDGIVVRSAALCMNDDSATATLQALIGNVIVARSATATTGTQLGASMPISSPDLVITTAALTMQTAAAVTTRDVVFMGCYETFTGTP